LIVEYGAVPGRSVLDHEHGIEAVVAPAIGPTVA